MKVSVVIPNFNRAGIIGETIENMLRQSLPPHEVIVVDDGSTDNSAGVIRSFGSRVKLIQQENKGPGAARNTVLARILKHFAFDPRYLNLWQSKGYNVTSLSYYSPIPDTGELPDEIWDKIPRLKGIEWNDAGQLNILAELKARYYDEYRMFP